MASPYRKLLDKKLGDLEDERRGYLERVIRRFEDLPDFAMSLNVVYLVLGECAPTVGTALPESEFVREMDRFLRAERRQIRVALFSRGFVFDQASVARELATLFEARVAERVLDGVREGRLEAEERVPFTFSWPDYAVEAEFPYEDDDEAETD